MKLILIIVILSILVIESFSMKMACPSGVEEVNCFVDPCFNKACPANPSAQCISNYCGGCNALWINSKGKQVRCERKRKTRCPSGVNEVRCFKDPCQGQTCPRDSSAQCIANYCGGCNFSWKKPNGQSAQC